jgi:hypothetical protein
VEESAFSRTVLVCSPGWLGEFLMVCGTHQFALSNDIQAAQARHGSKFSQCNVAWEGFPQARVQDVESLMLVAAIWIQNGHWDTDVDCTSSGNQGH